MLLAPKKVTFTNVHARIMNNIWNHMLVIRWVFIGHMHACDELSLIWIVKLFRSNSLINFIVLILTCLKLSQINEEVLYCHYYNFSGTKAVWEIAYRNIQRLCIFYRRENGELYFSLGCVRNTEIIILC